MKKKSIRYLLFGMIGIALFISLKTFHDYSEKNLDEVIQYKPNNFISLTIRDKSGDVEWTTYNKDAVEKLLTFLSNYRVKKISDRAYDDGGLSSDKRFEIIIKHSKAANLFALIQEDEVHIYKKGYYQVLNGPIDMHWVKRFQ